MIKRPNISTVTLKKEHLISSGVGKESKEGQGITGETFVTYCLDSVFKIILPY